MLGKIQKIVLGIRYSKSFRIPDIDGEISDEILYGDGTPFGPAFFPSTSEGVGGERTLYDEANEANFIRIHTEDIILSIKVSDFDADFKKLKDTYLPFLTEKVFRKFDIKNIYRIGVIYDHKLQPSDAMATLVTNSTNNAVRTPANIRFGFSEKLAVAEGQLKKGVNDWRNTIYTLVQSEESLLARLDYQHLFKPQVEDIRDAEPARILEESKAFLAANFHDWLNTYVNQQA